MAAIVTHFGTFEDASGIDCLVQCGEYLYSFNLIAGELRAHAVRVPSGYRSRRDRAIGINSCTAAAKRKVAELGPDYIARNVALYAAEGITA